MATLVDKYFSKYDMDAIESAIKKAETTTEGEIVVDLASHTRNWMLERVFYSILFGLLFGFAALFITRQEDWGVVYNLTQASLWSLAGFVVGYFGWGAVLKRTERRRKFVWKSAAERFLSLTPVRGKAGVLISVSLEENEAALVADTGIASKLPPEYWPALREQLVAALKEGKHAEGIIASINKLAGELTTHFPGGADDANQLPNRPNVID